MASAFFQFGQACNHTRSLQELNRKECVQVPYFALYRPSKVTQDPGMTSEVCGTSS